MIKKLNLVLVFIYYTSATQDTKTCFHDPDYSSLCIFKGITEVSQLYTLSKSNTENTEQITKIQFIDSRLYHIPSEITKTFEKLEELDASNCFLSRLFSMDFYKNNKIMRLNASYNVIHVLSRKFDENFKFLKSLDLSHNFLDIIESQAFSPDNNLKYLNLSHNRLKVLNQDFMTTVRNVKILNLDFNNLAELNDNIQQGFFYFEELYLNSNQLSTFNANAYKYLIKLDISYNNLQGSINFGSNLKLLELYIRLNALQSLSIGHKLEILDASECEDRDFNITFNNDSKLKILKLSNIISMDFERFFIEIKKLSHLEELDLSHNHFEPPLFDLLMMPKRLRSIDLERSYFKTLENIDGLEVYVPNLQRINIMDSSLSCTDFGDILYKLINFKVNVTGLIIGNETQFIDHNCNHHEDIENVFCHHELSTLWILLSISVVGNIVFTMVIFYSRFLRKKHDETHLLMNDMS